VLDVSLIIAYGNGRPIEPLDEQRESSRVVLGQVHNSFPTLDKAAVECLVGIFGRFTDQLMDYEILEGTANVDRDEFISWVSVQKLV